MLAPIVSEDTQSPILLAVLGVATVFNVEDVNEGAPVRVPEEVLEGLEAVRHAGYPMQDGARSCT